VDNISRIIKHKLKAGINFRFIFVIILTLVTMSACSQLESAIDSQINGLTLSKYQQLETGMSYEQAVSVLGSEGVEMSRSEGYGISLVTYQWSLSMKNITAMFQNNKLTAKGQFGLE
jgi:hypothetical protein